MEPSRTAPARLFVGVLLTTLVILAALVTGLTLSLRTRLREGVLRREAEAIHAVAQMQLASGGMPLVAAGASDVMPDLFTAVLESSRLNGVLAVQLFDARGNLREALPPRTRATGSIWWEPALPGPVARFRADGSLVDAIGHPLGTGAGVTPLLEVVVPLRGGSDSDVLGTARYWIDGAPVAAEFARMDHALLRQAGLAYSGAAVVIGWLLAWAYTRVMRAQREIAARSVDLDRANQELAFAARTAAVGAISAHLIHGLKNPLSGLEGFVLENAAGKSSGQGEAWQTAVDTTRRLRDLVNEVVAVLRDEAGNPAQYRVPVAEIIASVQRRTAASAEAADVTVSGEPMPAAEITARAANLASLVLANLVANAIEASPPGSSVTLAARDIPGAIEFLVRDCGPGITAELRAQLFQPVRSSKTGGGGIGLAISRQIARHAGGELDLAQSDNHGSVFRLRVPCPT